MKKIWLLLAGVAIISLAFGPVAEAKIYPAGGNVSGFNIDPATVTVGDPVTVTINATGKCAYTILGFPNHGLKDLKKSGPPYTFSEVPDKAGTFNLVLAPVAENTNPLWCTGTGGTAKLIVNPKPLADVLSPSKTMERTGSGATMMVIGRITGLKLPKSTIAPNDSLPIEITGDNGKCQFHLSVGKIGVIDEVRTANFDPKGSTISINFKFPFNYNVFSEGNFQISAVTTDADLVSGHECIIAGGSQQASFTVKGKSGPMTGIRAAKKVFAFDETPQVMVDGVGKCDFKLVFTNLDTKLTSEYLDYSAPFGYPFDGMWMHVHPGFDPGRYQVELMKSPTDPGHCDLPSDKSKTLAYFNVAPQSVELSKLNIAPANKVFKYGERQDYSIKGNKISKCYYEEELLQKKPGDAYYTTQLNVIKRTVSVPADRITDFALPKGEYRVSLVAMATLPDGSPNGCSGNNDLYFSVVPGATHLTSISPNTITVIPGQDVTFTVNGLNEGTGQNAGACDHMVYVRRFVDASEINVIGHYSTVPSKGPISIPSVAGDYYLSAESMSNTNPDCTGKVRSQLLKVLGKMDCWGGQPYNAGTEYGCYGLPPEDYFNWPCPDNYTRFQDSGPANPHFGCRKNASPAALVTAATLPTFQMGTSSAQAILGKSEQPVITGMTLIPGRSPSAKTVHADQGLQVEIKGNVSNAAGYGVHCSYTLTAEEKTTKKKVQQEFDTFDHHSLTLVPGTYDVTAESTSKEKSKGVACQGKAEIKNVIVIKGAAVLATVFVEAWGHHIGMASDGGVPQFCQNCDSFFSPAHDIGLVMIRPLFIPGPACSYAITQNADGDSKATLLIQPQDKPTAPSDIYDMNNVPFLNAYGADETKLTVTATGFANPWLPNIPPCEGTVTKKLTVYDDPSKPKQKL